MVIKETEIKNEIGLHARPATLFVQKANEHKASIWVEKDERRVNAKSLLGVLSLGVTDKSKIKIIAEGSGEEAAVEDLVALIENNFADVDSATA
jgi:phosphocarrier protein